MNYLELSPRIVRGSGRWVYKRESLLRETPAKMIAAAADSLPRGYVLSVAEGWRPPHIQRRMYLAGWQKWKQKHPDWSDVAITRLTNRFTAPPNDKVPPPHTTGGAVDLWLADEGGNVLDHLRPYDTGDRRAYPFAAAGLGEKALLHRRILADALLPTGITNYPSEYWHWSYGDQGWAYRGGHANAIYGPITPDGYEPNPEEDSDEPLAWVD